MKNLKLLALAAVAVGALTAFIGASTASATVLCSTTADPCPAGQKWPAGTILDFSLTAGTSLNQVETGGETIKTCKGSTIKGEITNAGSSTTTVTGKITELTWKECTFPTSTVLKGGFEIHKITGTSNGTVTADGETTWTTNTIFFGSCVYGVPSGTSIGDITEGKPSVLHVNAVMRKTEGSNISCPETGIWTATYTLTEPSNTTLSVSTS